MTDGSSDRVLLPILTWSIRRFTEKPVSDQWADQGRIPRTSSPAEKLQTILELYPCDLLFIHRDAEGQPPEWRRQEIATRVGDLTRHVPVVPVRMTEAWLLFDESAIRRAAGNPNGTENLELPPISKFEELANPKNLLYAALLKACGRSVLRRARFPVQQRVHLIPNYIDDYSALDSLSAFSLLQRDIRSILSA